MSMNTTMVDITALHDLILSGDEVVFIGRQGDEEISTEEIWDSTGLDPWTIHCNIGLLNWEDRYPKKLELNEKKRVMGKAFRWLMGWDHPG